MARILITGGTGTIGRMLIQRLSLGNNQIVFQYAHNDSNAAELSRNYGAQGIKISAEQLEKLPLAHIVEQNFEVLINCVGAHIVVEKAESVQAESLEKLYRVNVVFPFEFIKHVLPYMKAEKKGCIINVSSVCGLRTGSNNLPYILSKHAMSAMTKCIAEEYQEYGIRCNEVCPGVIESEMNDRIMKKEAEIYQMKCDDYVALEKAERLTGAFLDPSNVVDVIEFLLSDKASTLNGSSIVIGEK